MCRYHHLKEALELFDKIGARYNYEVRKTNIIGIEVHYNNRVRQMFTSKTPSDGNANKQIARDAKRLIMEMQK